MKQAENNDMDLLLRSLARRKGSKPFPREPMTEGSAESAHLDADELVSYAEQTLPSATRARYTIHLADCARCRKIVAELAPAVSVSVRDHPEGQSEATFWQTVRHFFSLPVWRYAVPALGLFAIVVVGLVVFRNQQPRSDMVAQNGRAKERVAVTQSQPTEVPQEKAAGTEEAKGYYDSGSNLNAQQKAKSGEQGQATGAAAPAPGAVAPGVMAKDAPADKTAKAVAQPTFAPEPPPPAPKPQDQVADARKEAVTRTEAASRPQSPPAKAPDTDREAYEGRGERRAEEEKSRAKNEQREAQGVVPLASNARDRDNLARLRSAQTLRTDSAGKKKSDDETAETRAVAGRRFSRQGNLWVDTAYHPGLSLTVVSRGSEQYRALVADEPSIGTIVEQLQGEVILIWKGRGYRIR
jgi:hypothetical protein